MTDLVLFTGDVRIRSTPRYLLDDSNLIAWAHAGEHGVVTNIVRDSDGAAHRWLYVQVPNADGTIRAGCVRDDVTYLGWDFTAYGLGVVSSAKFAYDVLPQMVPNPPVVVPSSSNVNNPHIAPVAASSSPATASGKFACPVVPSTNENDWHHVYAGVVHDGADLAGPLGSPILASADGIVVLVQKSVHGTASVLDVGIPLNSPAVLNDLGWSYGFGNVVVVRYSRDVLPASAQAAISDPWVYVLTAHCNDLQVGIGATVRAGMVIGHRGQSGNADGWHVHLQVMTSKDKLPVNIWQLPRVNPHLLFELPAPNY